MSRKDTEKKAQKLYNGITDISEELVQEAQGNGIGTKRLPRKRWGVLAACICAMAAGAFLWIHGPGTDSKRNGTTYDSDKTIPGDNGNRASDTVSSDGVTIPPLEISVPKEGETALADMIGFFIYQGRRYVQYDWLSDETAGKVIGEYLGTAKGSIDEWTPQNSYVELSGSIGGDFYSVNGFDPSFMLCIPRENGIVEIFICNTGITLKTGSDLYEDRLHLSDNYRAVQYETYASWHEGRNDTHQLDDPQSDSISEFIKALDAAEFLLWDDVPEEAMDKGVYFLFFEMENGMTIRLRLYEGGYVFFQGLMMAGVQIPEKQFRKTVELLAQN